MDYPTYLLCISLFLLHLSNKCFSIPPGVLGEVCRNENFTAECETGEVVVMEKARFGRMRLNRCVRINYGHIGCGTDVMRLADQKCSGRQSCLISYVDFLQYRSCPKDFRSYFEGSYRCVKVAEIQHELCRSSDSRRFVKLTSPSGFIASSSASSGCLSPHFPWIIKAQPGQVIQVSIIDFGSERMTSGYTVLCVSYAILREEASGRSTTICREMARNRDVYLTKGNSLEVTIREPIGANFLLGWKALGCTDPQVPPGGSFFRKGVHAAVSCDNTEDTWLIRCIGNSWSGYVGNCTSISSGSTKDHPFWTVFFLALLLGISVFVIRT